MTTLTWIYIVGAAVEALIVTVALFGLRSYCAKFRSKHLLPFVSTAIPWLVVAWLFWLFLDPVASTFLLVSVAGIYGPCIYWILNSPSDNHVD
jgi:hypothetical protein